MGAYYNTTDGKFIDFIYKPDKEMMLALAKQEVLGQALKNKLVSLSEQYQDINVKVPEGYQKQAQEILQPLGDNIVNLTSQIVKDPENVNLNAQLKSAIRTVSKELQSGDLAKMQNHYATWEAQNKLYAESLEKAKDEEERTGIRSQQNIYNAYMQEQFDKGYNPDFKVPSGAGYVNAQKILKETVDTAGLKYDMTRPGIMTGWHYQDPKTKQLIKADLNTMDIDQERRVVKDKVTGKVYGAAISYDPSIDYLTNNEFATYEHNLKGYYQNTIHQVALANLLNNDAFLSMERQKYRLGDAGGTKEDGAKETEQEYLYRKANENARIFASQYAETTEDKVTSDVKTDTWREEEQKHANALKRDKAKHDLEKPAEVIEIATITTQRYTQQEASKMATEFVGYMGRTNLTPQEEMRFKELQQLFGDAYSDERLDKAMSVSGYYTPEEISKMTKEEKVQKMIGFQEGIRLASKAATEGWVFTPFWATVLDLDPDDKRISSFVAKANKLAKNLKKAGFENEMENIAKSITYTDNAIVLTKKKKNDKYTTFNNLNSQFINQALSVGGKTVLSGTQYIYDANNRIKTQDDAPAEKQLAGDTHIQLFNKIKQLDDTGKIANWEDAVAAGFVSIKFLPQGTDVAIIITPRDERLNGLGVPSNNGVSLGTKANESFTVVSTGLDTKGQNSWKNLVSKEYANNPEVKDIINNTNPTYNNVKRTFQKIESSEIYKSPIGYRFNISNIESADYQKKYLGIQQPKDLEYLIVQKPDGFIHLNVMEKGTDVINEELGKYRTLEDARAKLNTYLEEAGQL